MRLKLITTALMIFGLVLLVGWPLTVGPRPSTSADARLVPAAIRQLPPARRDAALEQRRELAAWTLKYALYFLATLLTFAATAVCAIFVARQARSEFRAQADENIRALIEGTLEDHAKKRDG